MKWVLFALGAALCWGMYGVTLHMGQSAMGNSSMRAFLWVGIAYFLIAVLFPVGILAGQGQQGEFNFKGSALAGAAGALGAVGALCIIYAMIPANGGKPFYVMPLVFGGAPIVNVGFSMLLQKPEKMPSPWLFVGFLMMLAGAAMVLYFKPAAPAHH